MKKIIVYCELNKNNLTAISHELISKAKILKNDALKLKNQDYLVEAVAIGYTIEKDSIAQAYVAGADKVTLIKMENSNEFIQTVYASAFVEYYRTQPSEIILFPATPQGRILAPRITVALDTGLVADCIELDLIEKDDELKLAATRPTFGSELMATILSKKMPQCATVRPHTFEIKQFENNGEYQEYITEKQYTDDRTKVTKSVLEAIFDSTLPDAKVVLAGGYGLVGKNKNEYFAKLEKIANIINAKVATTRKVVDYGILPPTMQVGQTGLTIKPEVYIAFGVSGAIQHIVGMKNSKKIIAINTDENAEIFKYADYKIVADAKVVIDKLLEMVS